MNNFAIVETGGKQYKVSAGEKIRMEKVEGAEGGALVLDKILMTVSGAEVKIGTPYLTGAKAEARILRQARDKKKIVFRYHSKTRYRKKNTHRQEFTEAEIIRI